MKPYNLYLTVIYPLTYILKICNTYLKSDYVIRKICVCLAEEAGQWHFLIPFLPYLCPVATVLGFCVPHTLKKWVNIRGNSLQETVCVWLSFHAHFALWQYLWLNRGFTWFSSSQGKKQLIYLSNMALTFLTNLLNTGPKAKLSNWRFQMQSECNVVWDRQMLQLFLISFQNMEHCINKYQYSFQNLQSTWLKYFHCSHTVKC